MKRLADTKLDSLAKSVGLDQEDLSLIQTSKKQGFVNKLNPAYWFGQLVILLISLFYSMQLGIQKREAIYPFEYTFSALIFAPLPLSAHIINGVYSIKGEERAGLSKRVKLFVFFANFILFALLLYIYYLSVPRIVYEYGSAPEYGVFDSYRSQKTSVDLLIPKLKKDENINTMRGL